MRGYHANICLGVVEKARKQPQRVIGTVRIVHDVQLIARRDVGRGSVDCFQFVFSQLLLHTRMKLGVSVHIMFCHVPLCSKQLLSTAARLT
jgi:hypothetical protein